MSAKAQDKKIKLIQIGSHIGCKPLQKKVLLGLGLGKLGKSRSVEDTPAIRGMIFKVKHLLKVEEL